MDEIQQVLDRTARLAWVFENHIQWGWQQEDPDRLGERRVSDAGQVSKWQSALAQKMNRLVDTYFQKLEAREDRLSPHGSPKPAQYLEHKPPPRQHRCPNCGTDTRVGGTL